MPEHSSFPFLRLPLVLQLLILKHFRLDELINISLLGAQTKRVVKQLGQRIEKFKWSLYEERVQFEMYFPHQSAFFHAADPYDGSWKFELGPLVIHHKPPTPRSNGFVDSSYQFGSGTSSKDELLSGIEDLPSLLLEVFVCDQFELSCQGKQDIKNLFIWKYAKQFKDVVIDMESVSVDEISFLMNELKINKLNSRYFCNREGELYSGPVRVAHLNTKPLKWMTFDSFRNIECKTASIELHSLSSLELCECLSHWKSGTGWRNMEHFEMESPTREILRDRELREILGDLETFSWDRTGLPEKWRTSYGQFIYIENGRGMRRNDGRLATVFHEDRGDFLFVVWEEGLECEAESAKWENSDEDEEYEDEEKDSETKVVNKASVDGRSDDSEDVGTSNQ